MFTGLIEEKGRVVRVEPRSVGGMMLAVEGPLVSGDVQVGDSVSVNGVCLTAVQVSPPTLAFDVVKETVERSTLGRLKSGDAVNLERPLRAGGRFGGHMVLGHADGIGTVREIRKSGGGAVFRFEAPAEIMRYVVEKGSIAVDGVSLTVADLGAGWFTAAVIPHTLESTTLGDARVGNTVNLETDIIGKYVYKYMGKAAGTSDQRLLEKLAEGGFM